MSSQGNDMSAYMYICIYKLAATNKNKSSYQLRVRGDDLSSLDALVIGPPDTPYDGALLHLGPTVSRGP